MLVSLELVSWSLTCWNSAVCRCSEGGQQHLDLIGESAASIQTGVIPPLCLELVREHMESSLQYWAPQDHPTLQPQEGKGHGHTMYKERLGELQPYDGGCREGRASLSSGMQLQDTRQQSQVERWEFWLNIRTYFLTVMVIKLWKTMSIEVTETLDIFKAWLGLALFRSQATWSI